MKLTLDPVAVAQAPESAAKVLATTIARAYAQDVPRLVDRIQALEEEVARHRRAMFENAGEVEREKVYVLAWGRDCDQCEFSAAHEFDDMTSALLAEESFHRDAEGPQAWSYVDAVTYNEFIGATGGSAWRDHAAEQMGY